MPLNWHHESRVKLYGGQYPNKSTDSTWSAARVDSILVRFLHTIDTPTGLEHPISMGIVHSQVNERNGRRITAGTMNNDGRVKGDTEKNIGQSNRRIFSTFCNAVDTSRLRKRNFGHLVVGSQFRRILSRKERESTPHRPSTSKPEPKKTWLVFCFLFSSGGHLQQSTRVIFLFPVPRFGSRPHRRMLRSGGIRLFAIFERLFYYSSSILECPVIRRKCLQTKEGSTQHHISIVRSSGLGSVDRKNLSFRSAWQNVDDFCTRLLYKKFKRWTIKDGTRGEGKTIAGWKMLELAFEQVAGLIITWF